MSIKPGKIYSRSSFEVGKPTRKIAASRELGLDMRKFDIQPTVTVYSPPPLPSCVWETSMENAPVVVAPGNRGRKSDDHYNIMCKYVESNLCWLQDPRLEGVRNSRLEY